MGRYNCLRHTSQQGHLKAKGLLGGRRVREKAGERARAGFVLPACSYPLPPHVT